MKFIQNVLRIFFTDKNIGKKYKSHLNPFFREVIRK